MLQESFTAPARYLDYNATAPVRPQVIELVRELQALPLNASSVHGAGRKAKMIISQARSRLAEIIGVFASEVLFTASATEANNWALRSFPGHHLIVSAIEHASVLKTARLQGNTTIAPVTADGIVDVNALEAIIARQQGDFLVSVMLANNETGVIQPIRDIADAVHKQGGILHTDAVQALGKIRMDFNDLGCDMMTVAAHKMGGMIGSAALVVKNTLRLPPLLTGGGQESNQRAGTENVPAVAAFAKAVELIDLAQMQHLRGWLDRLEAEAGNAVGQYSPRLPNTSCIIMPGVTAETQMIHLDLDNIAVSAGSACSSGRIETSHVLNAMQVPAADANCAIRISGGWATTQEDITAAEESWKKLYERRQKR